MKTNNYDSEALINLFSSSPIINPKSGYGGAGSKVKGSYVNLHKPRLNPNELLSLMDDNLIRRVIETYPNNGSKSWFKIHFSNNYVTPSDLINYIDQIGNDPTELDNEIGLETVTIRSGFMEASIIARIYGCSYLILGIDDGLELSEPVNYGGIEKVNWCVVCDPFEITPDYDTNLIRSKPKGYIFTQNNQTIHPTRILKFYGAMKYGGRGRERYEGVSVIQLMFDAYSDWIIGLSASSEMLAQYDVFTLGVKGLGQMVMRDIQNGTTEGQRRIMTRAEAVNRGISQINGFLYDLDNELPGSVSRSYTGADAILENLEKRFIASTGMPRFKILNERQSGSLSDNGISQRYEWAKMLENWVSSNWRDNFSTLVKLVLLSKDSPLGKVDLKGVKVSAAFDLSMTDKERMELEKLAADRSKVLVDMGAVMPHEIRASYESGDFELGITLDESLDLKGVDDSGESREGSGKLGEGDRKEPNQDPNQESPSLISDSSNQSPEIDDGEWDSLANVTGADWLKVAREIAQGD